MRRGSAPPGAPPALPDGRPGSSGLAPLRPSPQAFSLPVGSFRQDATVIGGNPRTGPGGKPQESWRVPRGVRLSARAFRPGAPVVGPPRGLAEKAQEGWAREAGSVSRGDRSGEAQNSHESIGLCGPRLAAGTDLCGEQSPGAAGHRELLVLRAGARDAENCKRARAPKGVRLHRGETLCRVNPMSGTSPMGWETRGGANRQEGGKPWRRTGSGLESRLSKLFRAEVAVGATNPMRAV